MVERVGVWRKAAGSRDGEDLFRGQDRLGIALKNRETEFGDDLAELQMVYVANKNILSCSYVESWQLHY